MWAGGSIWLYARKKISGVDYIVDFEDLASTLGRWNRTAQTAALPRPQAGPSSI
jgi:hypothetical protein